MSKYAMLARRPALNCAPKYKGFTIIELLVTVVIVSIIASVAFPMAELAVQRNKEQDLRRTLREIREALDAYKTAGDEGRILRQAGESGYPSTLEILVDGVEDAKSPARAKIYFLRRIPRDPFAVDGEVSAAETWGKRSYASSADDPKEGADVYDIYSLSKGVGLNGIAYRDW
jgi:general secretion pathway protein G